MEADKRIALTMLRNPASGIYLEKSDERGNIAINDNIITIIIINVYSRLVRLVIQSFLLVARAMSR